MWTFVLISALLAFQIAFFIVLTSEYWIFLVLEISITTCLSALGAFAVLRKIRPLYFIYGTYLLLYIFVGAGLIFGLIFGWIFSWETPTCPNNYTNNSSVKASCERKLEGADLVRNVLAINFDFLSILICMILFRILWVEVRKMNNKRIAPNYFLQMNGAPPSYTTEPGFPQNDANFPTPPIYLDVRQLNEKRNSRARTGSLPSRLYEI